MEEKKKAANVKVPEKDRKVHIFIYLFIYRKIPKISPEAYIFQRPF